MDELARRNRRVGLMAATAAGLMVGLAFASVPLYDLFCRMTGYAGTTQVATKAPDQPGERVVTIRFNADTAQGLPWGFRPEQVSMQVRVGEEHMAFYKAVNRSGRPITGTATFNVQPDQAGIYFQKLACFCFTEQTLAPGQSVDMPVSFFVDPAMADDPAMARVNTITLSYTFFEAPAKPSRVSAAANGPQKTSFSRE